MVLGITFVIGGLLLLTFGGDRLVLSAARLSTHWGASPILVGALVVGMGTSAPELLVSLVAASCGGLDLAVGNIVGSNVANLSLVLGVSVMLVPVAGQSWILRREGGLMLISVVVMTLCVWNGFLSWLEGIGLVVGMVVAVAIMIQWARQDRAARCAAEAKVAEVKEGTGKVRPLIDILTGFLALTAILVGAELLVRGAQTVARGLGFSEAFIGLTLVALGTSLPELATAIAAAMRRENDLLIGNLLGSNLFNSLAVLGAAALAGNGALVADFRVVSLGMVLVCTLAGLFIWTGDRLVRAEGAILIVAYAAFIYLST